ncbi:peptidoglycan-recognition protein LC isoform X4 [Drosophila hydei]|uniref:Peptidoglycan-recognition protein LC isoform X4 n=1 Tax=Drosophila hydei TaxID=7224 RepID=A0A6J1MBP7_DROHY|nr:peptidoglycan-recognition protein LC isoform X4 [Drosophila hydei]
MYCDNGTELNTSTNTSLHIINRSSGKNCSTSSTDSGVGLLDNGATFKAGPTTKDNSQKTSRNCEATTEPTQTEAEGNAQKRISIEVEATVKLNNGASAAYRPKKSSPALSIRSTTISIVSIDENAIDSSCIDSDSEADADESCTVQKLGQQTTYPPQSAELTQLNKGLTVISRQVVPTTGADAGATPTAPDVVARQLLNGNLSLATPTTPASTQQIGSIALTNTTDVTFGDKHYYEGPVTIQQILIDNREKWKTLDGETGGQENPGFNSQATANGNAAGGKLNESCKEPVMCPFLPSTIASRAVFVTAAFAILTIGLLVILATTTNLFSKTLNKTIDGSKLVLVSIDEWDGKMTRPSLERLKQPVSRVIIAHTVTENCYTLDACSYRVRAMQAYHMDSLDWPQIGYNFMVGGDGRVYVGRGWDYIGAHTIKHNSDSIGIAFIGSFDKSEPTQLQLRGCELLLEEGVRLMKLSPKYQVYGHRQLLATQSPGDRLYNIIRTWSHFAKTT